MPCPSIGRHRSNVNLVPRIQNWRKTCWELFKKPRPLWLGLTRKFKQCRSTVRRSRLRAGYKSYRAIKKPNRTMKQNVLAKNRARLLYDKVLTKFKGCFLMDDETCETWFQTTTWLKILLGWYEGKCWRKIQVHKFGEICKKTYDLARNL